MNVYIACGLTHVPREEFHRYTAFLHELAAHLTHQCQVSVRYALRDSDPQLADKPFDQRARLCYLWDREMVEWANVVIAEASFPSTGLGIELQIAENLDIPIILCFEQKIEHKATPVDYETPDHVRHSLQLGEGYISLMALGLPSVFQVISYSESHVAFEALVNALQMLTHPQSASQNR